MKVFLLILGGIAAAVAYGFLSHALTGNSNCALAFGFGSVVALALSGFCVRIRD